MKLGKGLTARCIPYSGRWVGMSGDRGFMCCNCASHCSVVEPECYNCGATLVQDRGPATDVERRDMQIHALKHSVASGWDFQGVLLNMLAAWERGEKPEWPKEYGKGAQLWLDRNGWSKGKKGDDIARVTEFWNSYGLGGDL